MLGIGRDNLDLEPLDLDGNRQTDNPNASLGCHTGYFQGLNVFNPQPGWVYYWADSSPRGIQDARLSGREVVQAGDPEYAAYNRMFVNTGSNTDSAQTGYPGVILTRRHITIERELREQEAEVSRNLLRSGAVERDYIEGGRNSPEEMAAARVRKHDSLRFQTHGHGSRIVDGVSEDGRVVEAWSPNAGIARDG
jgi:hypothetical protein